MRSPASLHQFVSRRTLLTVLFSAILACGPVLVIAGDSPDAAKPGPNPNVPTQPGDVDPDKGGWPKYVDKAAGRMKQVAIVLSNYAKDHNNQLPPDLGSLYADWNSPTAEVAEIFLTPGEESSTEIPDNADADWINQHTSYVYLGRGVNLDQVKMPALDTRAGLYGATVLFHTRLDQPFYDPKLGQVVILGYLDCHIAIRTIQEAGDIIKRSKRILQSGRDADSN